MSQIHDYPRVPVRLETWQEALRRCAAAIKYLLERVGQITEPGVLDTATVVDAVSFRGYSLARPVSDESAKISHDATNGTITVGEAGLYLIHAFIEQTGGSPSSVYAYELVVTAGPSAGLAFVVGGDTFAVKVGGFVFSATVRYPLAEGDVLLLRPLAAAALPVIGDFRRVNFGIALEAP